MPPETQRDAIPTSAFQTAIAEGGGGGSPGYYVCQWCAPVYARIRLEFLLEEIDFSAHCSVDEVFLVGMMNLLRRLFHGEGYAFLLVLAWGREVVCFDIRDEALEFR